MGNLRKHGAFLLVRADFPAHTIRRGESPRLTEKIAADRIPVADVVSVTFV